LRLGDYGDDLRLVGSLLLQEQPFVEARHDTLGQATRLVSLLLQEQPFVEAMVDHHDSRIHSAVAAPSGAALR